VLALKTEFALNFSSRGDCRPPSPPPRTPLLFCQPLTPNDFRTEALFTGLEAGDAFSSKMVGIHVTIIRH